MVISPHRMSAPDTSVLLFENAAARISLEAAGFLRFQELPGPRQPALHRQALDELLNALDDTAVRRFLMDRRHGELYDEPMQDWVVDNWLPRLVTRFREHRAANLIADDVFSRLSIVPILAQAYRLGYPHQTFDNEAEAVAWLLR